MKNTGFVIALVLLALAPVANARNTVLNIPLADVLSMPEASAELDGSVKFYLLGSKTPPEELRLGSFTAARKTHGTSDSDEFGCKWAALSALKSFQIRAKAVGANAVIEIVSSYKNKVTRSDTTIECRAGDHVKDVNLMGFLAKVAR